MKFANFNEELRNEISNMLEGNNPEYILYLYDKVKENTEFSRYLMGLILTSSYICINMNLQFNKKNKELNKVIDNYNNTYSAEEYIDNLTEEEFILTLTDLYNFNMLDYDARKRCVENSKDRKKHLVKLFPCYILDLLYYTKYNSDEMIRQYDKYLPAFGKNEAIENTVIYNAEKLIDLYEEDFNNYKDVILDIIEIYYKYNTYLIANGEKIDDTDINNMNDIDEDLFSMINFCGNSSYLLEPIIRKYIKYEVNDHDAVDRFYMDDENSRKLVKLNSNINEIRNKNYK